MSPSVVEPTDGHVVAMSGAVNPGMVIALHRTISAAVDAGHRVIVIDLSAVTFLGPQTAGLFCGALRRLERRGAALEILGGPQPFQRMLVTGGGSSRVTQRAKRDGQRSLDVIAAFGDHLSTADMGDTPTGKVAGAAVHANHDYLKQDMQLGNGRAQQQAETAKNKARDGDAFAAPTRR
jgi:anti-anti-sigma regulatory factor